MQINNSVILQKDNQYYGWQIYYAYLPQADTRSFLICLFLLYFQYSVKILEVTAHRREMLRKWLFNISIYSQHVAQFILQQLLKTNFFKGFFSILWIYSGVYVVRVESHMNLSIDAWDEIFAITPSVYGLEI